MIAVILDRPDVFAGFGVVCFALGMLFGGLMWSKEVDE